MLNSIATNRYNQPVFVKSLLSVFTRILDIITIDQLICVIMRAGRRIGAVSLEVVKSSGVITIYHFHITQNTPCITIVSNFSWVLPSQEKLKKMLKQTKRIMGNGKLFCFCLFVCSLVCFVKQTLNFFLLE